MSIGLGLENDMIVERPAVASAWSVENTALALVHLSFVDRMIPKARMNFGATALSLSMHRLTWAPAPESR